MTNEKHTEATETNNTSENTQQTRPHETWSTKPSRTQEQASRQCCKERKKNTKKKQTMRETQSLADADERSSERDIASLLSCHPSHAAAL